MCSCKEPVEASCWCERGSPGGGKTPQVCRPANDVVLTSASPSPFLFPPVEAAEPGAQLVAEGDPYLRGGLGQRRVEPQDELLISLPLGEGACNSGAGGRAVTASRMQARRPRTIRTLHTSHLG